MIASLLPAAILAAALARQAGPEPAPAPRTSFAQRHASVLGLVLEQATFRDAQRALGPAEVRHNRGDAASSAYFACYVGRDGTALVLEGAVEKGAGAITSFQLLRDRELANFSGYGYKPPAEALPRCLSARRLNASVATGGGVRLGMTCAEIARLLRGAPARATESECAFVLTDSERPVRDRDGTLIGHPTAWIMVTLKDGKAVAILVDYSSMV